MKSQFVKFPSFDGNERPDPDDLAKAKLAQNAQLHSASAQVARNIPPTPTVMQTRGQIPQRPAKGLLSSWNTHSAQPAEHFKAEELEINKHPVIDRQAVPMQPRSEPAWYQNLQGPDPRWPWGTQAAQPQPGPNVQTPVYARQSAVQGPSAPYASPLYLAEMPLPPSPSYSAGHQNGAMGGPPHGKTRYRKKKRFPTWARVVVIALAVVLALIGGGAGYLYFTFSPSVGNIVNQQVQRSKGEEDPNASRNGADILSGPRINILLLGSDTDQKFTNADGTHNYLAQTDIVVTIDPATKSVGMLSIPRDFYINVPNNGMHKLDEAYSLGGSVSGNGAFSPGGVALSRLTIEQDFGISINYYAWIGLDGFVKVIDTVGGVDVDVTHPITDDNYPNDVGNKTNDRYSYMRLYLPPGPQHLDGITALEYVRSRHADLVGDFGRSARQQQVLSALKTKLNNPDIVGKLPTIANDLNGYVKTDMQLSDVFKLMNFARTLDPNSINKVILDAPYSSSGTLPNGDSVVYPNCAKIVPVIAKMFNSGSQAACNIQANGSSTTSVATASTASPPLVSQVATVAGSAKTADQLASTSLMSLFGGGNFQDIFGIHNLLDLLLLGVFESPQALQV